MNALLHKSKSISNHIITKPLKKLIDFFSPLTYDWKLALLIFLGVLFVLPFTALFIFDLWHNSFKDTFLAPNTPLDLKWLFALWTSLFGIFVSIRIYFEVKNKANNLQEFMRLVYLIINKAKVNENIYIVLPTAFIGYLSYLKGSNYSYTKFESKLKKLENLKIAFLKTDISAFPEINEKEIESDESNGKLGEFLSNVDASNLLIHFHEKEFIDKKSKKKHRYKYFARLINFMKELEKSQTDNKNTIDFIKQTDIDDKFDIIVANVDQADCFIGDVDVLSQIDIKYSGERIVSENLAKNIEMIYNSYITTP